VVAVVVRGGASGGTDEQAVAVGVPVEEVVVIEMVVAVELHHEFRAKQNDYIRVTNHVRAARKDELGNATYVTSNRITRRENENFLVKRMKMSWAIE
jgi:hypothetical protein